MENTLNFYADVVPFERFSDVMNPSHYRRAPDDWCVVITDVVGSTKAIANNRYKEVNMLGASSIVAILNCLNRKVPFVFGGDGATVLVHTSDVDALRPALLGTQKMAKEAFDLEIRSGIVPLADLSAHGASVEVAKYKVSEQATLAMIRGGGLNVAERWIKSGAQDGKYLIRAKGDEKEGENEASFQGLSCRWSPIPARRGEMISLLVMARAPEAEVGGIYDQVLEGLEKILKDDIETHPVTPEKLDKKPQLRNLLPELKIRGTEGGIGRLLGLAAKTLFEYFIVQFTVHTGLPLLGFQGRQYVKEMAVSTDFRKFDDMLRMIRDCDPVQRQAIVDFLEGLRGQGKIAYGVHVSNKALMTCLVFNTKTDHVHFIDGDSGGYAMAAKQLKAQLAAS